MVWVLLAVIGRVPEATISGGLIPARLTLGLDGTGFVPAWLTPFSSVLLHANLLHIGLNMLMLVITGLAVERVIGRGGLALLYLAGAVAAGAAQWAADPLSQVPVIGASGAISAVVAAYAMLFGENRVRNKDPRIARALHVAWLAAAWIGLQLLLGFATSTDNGPSIAILAHIGGFLAGLFLVKPLLRFRWRKA